MTSNFDAKLDAAARRQGIHPDDLRRRRSDVWPILTVLAVFCLLLGTCAILGPVGDERDSEIEYMAQEATINAERRDFQEWRDSRPP